MTEANLNAARQQKETGGVHNDIARIEGEQMRKAEESSQGSVTLEGWGTFHKLPSGGWRGPGGNYGPTTELGKQLGQAYESQAMQRHHDYYMQLDSVGRLTDEDRGQFNLARQRETDGLVKPWSPEPPEVK